MTFCENISYHVKYCFKNLKDYCYYVYQTWTYYIWYEKNFSKILRNTFVCLDYSCFLLQLICLKVYTTMIKVQIPATLTQGCFSSTSISDKKEYARIQPPAVWQTKHLYLGVGCFKQSVTCSKVVPTAWRMDASHKLSGAESQAVGPGDQTEESVAWGFHVFQVQVTGVESRLPLRVPGPASGVLGPGPSLT